jgi:hypothetical protein
VLFRLWWSIVLFDGLRGWFWLGLNRRWRRWCRVWPAIWVSFVVGLDYCILVFPFSYKRGTLVGLVYFL